MAESGAEASLKEVPKKDLTAFAKAVSAAHEPSAFADWTTPSNPRRNNGREGEAKESPEEKLATAVSFSQRVHTPHGCSGSPTGGSPIGPLPLAHAQGIDEWKTGKGEPNLIDLSKKTTKNTTPIGRVDPNGLDEPNLVDCSKSTTPIDPPTAPSGVTKEDPALEPAAAGDAPLPSMKEFPAARTLHSAPCVCRPTP